MNFIPTKTLLISSASYVGAHEIPHLAYYLARQLLENGRSVTVLGKTSSPKSELVQGVRYVTGDFSKKKLISCLLSEHEEVIYLAHTSVLSSNKESLLDELILNLQSAVQLFSEAADKGVKLVFISSGGSVYGEARELPINETHLAKPISSYGITKLTLENYAYLYAATRGLKFVCVRVANVYGKGQRPFVGQGFIATAIATAMKGLPIKVFGNYGTVRDYIYVSDIASGIVSAMLKGLLSETYNLGSGIGLSNLEVIDVLKLIRREIGLDVIVEHMPEHALDVKANILDSKKLQEHTDWKPQVKFEEGMRKTYEWLGVICK